ncbi:MAG: hypothetical protein ACRDO4_07250, partial [Nocardioides sp.]
MRARVTAAAAVLGVLAPLLVTAGPAASGTGTGPRSEADPDRQARTGTTVAAGSVDQADIEFAPRGRRLHDGTPREAGLVADHLARVGVDLRR